MLTKTRFAILSSCLVIGLSAPTPVLAQYTDYEQCLIDHCFGNFQGDPVGYERCRRACATKYPPQIASTSNLNLDVKLN